MINQNNLASVQFSTAGAYWSMGQVDDALNMLDSVMVTGRISGASGTALRLGQMFTLAVSTYFFIDAGQLAKARAIADELGSYAASLQKSEPAGSLAGPYGALLKRVADARIAAARGDDRAARDICADINTRLGTIHATSGRDQFIVSGFGFQGNEQKARSELALKEYGAAEQSARAALAAKEKFTFDPRSDERTKAQLSTILALSLVGQGKPGEAREVIEPVVKLHRDLARRNQSDETQKVEMAAALYAEALADPPRRSALLRESRALLDSVPAQIKALASTRLWSERVRAASG